jgi:hypothetical protein
MSGPAPSVYQYTLAEFRSWCRATRSSLGAWKLCALGLKPLFERLKSSAMPTLVVFEPQSRLGEPESLPSWTESCQVAWPTASGHVGLCDPAQLKAHPQWTIRLAPDSAPNAEPDVILVPCEAADRSGARLGRGSGFYDRLLAQYPQALRIGIVHASRLLERFSPQWIQPHDAVLDAVWTQNEFFWTSQPTRQSLMLQRSSL